MIVDGIDPTVYVRLSKPMKLNSTLAVTGTPLSTKFPSKSELVPLFVFWTIILTPGRGIPVSSTTVPDKSVIWENDKVVKSKNKYVILQ